MELIRRANQAPVVPSFVLSTSVRAPIPSMAVSNGLRPGLASSVKDLADSLGPAESG